MPTPHPDLAFALSLADEADAVTLARFRDRTLAVERKPDATPVTEIDRDVERRMRARIERERPGEAIVGEELGSSGDAAARWILDPIDATKNYVRGIPIFATLVALEREGVVEVGVVSAPALGRRWWARRGDGAFADGAPIRVSAIDRLDEAQLGYDDLAGFEAHGLGDAFVALARRFGRARGFGDFYTHVLVAEGAIEAAVEPAVALWDLAALQVIVEEAGGRFTSIAGERTPAGGSALSTNGLLHDEVLSALTPP